MSTKEINYALELRLKPNLKQRVYLSKLFGCNRFIYNHCLSKINEQYELDKAFLFYNDTNKLLKELKSNDNTNWLKEVDSTALQQSLRNLDTGLSNYIQSKKGKRKGKSVGFPKFKSKSNRQSAKVICINNNIKLDLDKGTLKIPKLKEPIKIISDKRRPKGIISSITLKKNPSGKYFVSILFKQEVEIKQPKLDLSKSVGLDFGLKTFITTSDDKEIESPLFLNKQLKKLKRLSRQHSKKKINSNNRMKSRIKLARLQEQIANQRKDFNHKLSKQLLDEYDYIFIEDLNLEAMKQLWGKKISDLAFYQLVSFIEYKAERDGKILYKIDRYYPSSKLCSKCNHKNTHLKLSDRIW